MLPNNISLSGWLEAQAFLNGITPFDEKQLEFLTTLLHSPLTISELQKLFRIAHRQLNEKDGKLLLKLLDEQSPCHDP